MTDQGRLADPLGHRECLMKCAMEHQPGRFRLDRLSIGGFELAKYLRLAYHHRVQARADPEQMAHRVAPFVTVKRWRERASSTSRSSRQKLRGLDLAARCAALRQSNQSRLDCKSRSAPPR